MKSISNIVLFVLLVLNVIVGILFSCYPMFNMILNCIIICLGIAFMFGIRRYCTDNAFRLSLAFMIPLLTLFEIALGTLSPPQIKDNWYIIGIICCMAFEFLLIYTMCSKSKNH